MAVPPPQINTKLILQFSNQALKHNLKIRVQTKYEFSGNTPLEKDYARSSRGDVLIILFEDTVMNRTTAVW
jgi:hypothetical protein